MSGDTRQEVLDRVGATFCEFLEVFGSPPFGPSHPPACSYSRTCPRPYERILGHQVALHTILCVRGVYPAELFERKRSPSLFPPSLRSELTRSVCAGRAGWEVRAVKCRRAHSPHQLARQTSSQWGLAALPHWGWRTPSISQVGMQGLRHEFFKFGAGKSPGSPN